MIKFGPAGNSASFYNEGFKHTIETPKWLMNKGLDCFEYSLGRGIKIKDETAFEISKESKKYKIEFSVHAPYYINFASQDTYENSLNYIINSLKVLEKFNGERLVFHIGSPKKNTREKAFCIALDGLKKMVDDVYCQYPNFENLIICPETMGKIGQIGSIEEIIEVCRAIKQFVPCVDFGHINARYGGILKTEKDFDDLISKFLDEIGDRALKMHMHFSHIEYSKGGEVKHLTFEDKIYGPFFENLAPVIKKNKMSPYIICESDNTQAEDALMMKNIYNSIL